MPKSRRLTQLTQLNNWEDIRNPQLWGPPIIEPRYIHGLGYPEPEDVPSEEDLVHMLEQRILSYERDRNATVRLKATSFVDQMEETDRIKFSRKRTPYWYVTINPKPGISLEKLHNQVVVLLSQPGIKDPIWCYEIRAKPDQGLHCHILFTKHTNDRNYPQRKVKNLFVPSLCGNNKHIHIKWITKEELAAVQSYIAKETVSQAKRGANDATLSWRQLRKIPKIFTEDHLLVWSELTPKLNSRVAHDSYGSAKFATPPPQTPFRGGETRTEYESNLPIVEDDDNNNNNEWE